ncbi:MAG: thioredoxin family protein [Planctomycetes bacterium]|nr:thioredoxin family protein [Planctomycetota bacterium]MCH9724283.1 thioredoxin family protein [Planctomycetota bacterium]MCH9777302.1 thioredoxin family protein [Planctomycetota bacterium]MCH9793026.1 thioredoxin family protein [Planctomycetota bacterium]MDF1742363.1 thioredoxin family protein [Gimesia sp.]
MNRLSKHIHWVIISFSLVLLVGISIELSQAETDSKSSYRADTGIKWHTDLDSAHQSALKSNKPVFIVFDASWCTFCRKLEKETLSDPRMVRYLNQAFEPVHLDFDKDRKIADVLKVKSIPCTVVLSSEADLLARQIGYSKVPSYHSMLEKARKLQAVIRHIEYTEGR